VSDANVAAILAFQRKTGRVHRGATGSESTDAAESHDEAKYYGETKDYNEIELY